MVTFQSERFQDIYEEVSPLLLKHWQEIARNKETIVYAPDTERYQRIYDSGSMLILTARQDGNLIGYAVYFLSPHMHYKNDTWALSDIFWMSPDYRGRGLGIRLFREAERLLREKDVSVMHTTTKVAHPGASRILEHMGHSLIEYGFAKVLKGQ